MQPWGLLNLALFLGFFIVAVIITVGGLPLVPAVLILGVAGLAIILFAVTVS